MGSPVIGVRSWRNLPVVTYSGAVSPGSTGNALTFIIADANDHS